MKVTYDKKEFFKDSESITTPKVLLNVCDPYQYNITDSNIFYSNYYTTPEKVWKSGNRNMGSISIDKIFSYHIICNMICIDLPKTQWNLVPFKYKYFELCCKKLKEYCDSNDIKLIASPIFGTEVIEGNWKKIISILNSHFPNFHLLIYK